MAKAIFDYVFSFFHIFLLVAIIIYAFSFLFQGDIPRFALISACLTGYYFLVLHKNVKKEIQRKRKMKTTPEK